MSSATRKALLFAVAVVALVLFWTWWRSPQRQVYRRLDELAGAMEKHGDESPLASALAARHVTELFAPGFQVRAAPYEGELRDPQALAGAVLRLRTGARSVDVSLSDRQFQLGPAGNTAVVAFVGRVVADRGNGPGREAWRVRSLWVKDAEGWRISELELVERLEGGGLFGA